MKTAIVRLSEVQDGNGCMLPNRFLDACGECDIVMRCPNKQAYKGRVDRLTDRVKKNKQRLRELRIIRIRLVLTLWYIRTLRLLLPLYAPIIRLWKKGG